MWSYDQVVLFLINFPPQKNECNGKLSQINLTSCISHLGINVLPVILHWALTEESKTIRCKGKRRSRGSSPIKPESSLHNFTALWPWKNYLTSLVSNFPIYEITYSNESLRKLNDHTYFGLPYGRYSSQESHNNDLGHQSANIHWTPLIMMVGGGNQREPLISLLKCEFKD